MHKILTQIQVKICIFFHGSGHFTAGIKGIPFLLLILLYFIDLLLPGSALKSRDLDETHLSKPHLGSKLHSLSAVVLMLLC